MTTGAVDDDAREHDDHGDEAGEVSEVLLGTEPVVVMGRRREVDEDVGEEGDCRQREADVDEPRHAGQVVRHSSDRVYHQHTLVIHPADRSCQVFR